MRIEGMPISGLLMPLDPDDGDDAEAGPDRLRRPRRDRGSCPGTCGVAQVPDDVRTAADIGGDRGLRRPDVVLPFAFDVIFDPGGRGEGGDVGVAGRRRRGLFLNAGSAVRMSLGVKGLLRGPGVVVEQRRSAARVALTSASGRGRCHRSAPPAIGIPLTRSWPRRNSEAARPASDCRDQQGRHGPSCRHSPSRPPPHRLARPRRMALSRRWGRPSHPRLCFVPPPSRS